MKAHLLTLNHRSALLVAMIMLLIYFLPFLLLGENSYFTIHDNLDITYLYNCLLAATGQTYNFNPNFVMENIMCGLPRSLFGNGLFIVTTLFFFFKPATAYIINFIITHFIGFTGMFLLLRRHILKEQSQYVIAVACSVLFAFIPFYSIFGAGISYQPLLLYAFLNLINDDGRHWKDYLIIAFYPFYSMAVFLEPFVFIALAIILLIKTLSGKKFYSKYFLGLLLLFLMTFIFEYSIIYQNFFKSDFISSRIEFKKIDLLSTMNYKLWWDTNFLSLLYKTQYHTGEFYAFPVIAAVLVATGILLAHKNYSHPIFYLIFSILFICVIFASAPLLAYKFGDRFQLFKTLQFDRFYFLLPAIWIVLFAYCIKEMTSFNRVMRLFAWCLIIIQLSIILACNTEIKNNVKLLLNRRIGEPTGKEFFSENLFNGIRNYIGIPQKEYRVVSIGMHPSVAIYNGFYSLDGYQAVYDLRYKHQFRQIIAKELDKDKTLKDYFDKWGARCYIFSAELGRNYLYGKNSFKTINNLSLDFYALKKMECRYLLSSVRINNLDTSAVRFEKKFEDNNSYWEIYLYKLL